jgi:adenine deaminase
MRLPPRLRLSRAARHELVAAAGGQHPADLILSGARVLNVFTGALRPADIGIAAGRIAWVGENPGLESLNRQDLGGAIVVPGLIDAHSHVDLMSVPSQFIAAAARFGTTLVAADLYFMSRRLDDESLRRLLTQLDASPTKLLWGLRSSLAGGADEPEHPIDRLRRLLEWEGISSSGEWTSWPALLTGDARQEEFATAVLDAGLRIDGHLPGASPSTLSRLAAAGVSSDHEAINGDELAARVDLGYWSMVRHVALRPDGPALGAAIVERSLPTTRLLLTADGPLPREINQGHLDNVIRTIVAAGVDPIAAVTMATLNPAVYLGLDAHVGAVAPGRCADLVVLEGELADFRPARVFCDGRELSVERTVEDAIDWQSFGVVMRPAELDATALAEICDAGPALAMRGVFARLDERPGEASRAYIALISRDGSWIVGATIDTFDFPAVATSLTGDTDLLLIGRDPEAMLAAYRRVIDMGGGLACPGDELPMPVLGEHSDLPVAELAVALEHFEATSGVGVGPVPFSSRSMFLTLPALPSVCLTPRGVVDVRSSDVLSPPRSLTPAGAAA